jgi:integrase
MKFRKIPKCVRPEEFIKLVKVVPKKKLLVKVVFLLAYGAGMRISEVLRCEPQHFRGNSIFIPPSKYGVERIVPIPKGWKQNFTEMLPIKKSIRSLERWFKKYSKIADLPSNYSFHSLRHGFATRCLESGVPLNQVQVLMGHSDISTTGIYLKANPQDALKNYEELF